MSLLDQIATDVAGVFLSDFAQSVVYTQNGGAPRTIKALILAEEERSFDTGSSDAEIDLAEIQISSADDVSGVIAPNEMGRTTALDTLTLPGSVTVWYVRKILQHGLRGGEGMHTLLISDSQAPLE